MVIFLEVFLSKFCMHFLDSQACHMPCPLNFLLLSFGVWRSIYCHHATSRLGVTNFVDQSTSWEANDRWSLIDFFTFMWPCIVTCDRAPWHVTVHRDMWLCTVTCDRAPWHVIVHRDMWPCTVTCDRASWHVIVHRDMWSCIVTCDRASWHVTVHRNKFLCNKTNQMH